MSIIGNAIKISGSRAMVPRRVDVYGAANSSVSYSGPESGTLSLDENGHAKVHLIDGTYLFEDGYISGNNKTIVISGSNKVAGIGAWFGSGGTITLFGDESYSHIVGVCDVTLTQWSKSGGGQTSNYRSPYPSGQITVDISYSGDISGTIYNGVAISFPRLDGGSGRSSSDTIDIDEEIEAIGGDELTISCTYTTAQGSGNSYVGTTGDATLSGIYVY